MQRGAARRWLRAAQAGPRTLSWGRRGGGVGGRRAGGGRAPESLHFVLRHSLTSTDTHNTDECSPVSRLILGGAHNTHSPCLSVREYLSRVRRVSKRGARVRCTSDNVRHARGERSAVPGEVRGPCATRAICGHSRPGHKRDAPAGARWKSPLLLPPPVWWTGAGRRERAGAGRGRREERSGTVRSGGALLLYRPHV